MINSASNNRNTVVFRVFFTAFSKYFSKGLTNTREITIKRMLLALLYMS
jgi:hypothetical protein